jgi:hypothetical protein
MKERSSESGDIDSRRGSVESIRSPSTSHQRAPTLSDVPEEDTFAIGDDEDEDSDDEQRPTRTPTTPTQSDRPSRASSVSSSFDETVPTQLRGMSEKARGKMPGKNPNPPPR